MNVMTSFCALQAVFMRYMQEMSFQESDMMVDCISESRDVITGTTDVTVRLLRFLFPLAFTHVPVRQ